MLLYNYIYIYCTDEYVLILHANAMFYMRRRRNTHIRHAYTLFPTHKNRTRSNATTGTMFIADADAGGAAIATAIPHSIRNGGGVIKIDRICVYAAATANDGIGFGL